MATAPSNSSRRQFLKIAILGSTITAAVAACQSAPSQTTAPTAAASSGSAGGQATAAPTASAGGKTTAAPAATAAQSAAGPITLQMWQPWSDAPSIKVWETMVAQFEKANPKYKIDLSNAATVQKTLTAISGGSPPDAFLYYDSTYVGSWANTGAIINLTSWMDDNGYQTKIPKGVLNRCSLGSAIFACPYMTDGYMLMYNKDVFDQENLQPPKTMDDIVAIDAKLTKKEGNKITRVGYHPMYDRFFSAAMVPMYGDQMGGHWYDEDNHKIMADDAPNIAALEWERGFYERHGTSEMQNFVAGLGKEGQPTDPVATGLIMMEIAGEWRVDGGVDGVHSANPKFNYGVAPVPIDAKHPQFHDANWSTGTATTIPHNAKHGQDALNFLSWLLELDQQLYISNNIVNLPVTLEALSAGDKITNTDMRTFSEYLLKSAQAGNVHIWPSIPVSQEYMDAVVKAEELAVGGKQSAADALKAVVTQVQPQLDAAFQNKKA